MRYTIFNTPVVTSVLRGISAVILKATGWRKAGPAPDLPKYVAIFAPHTSNWDLPMVLFYALVLRVNIVWLGKDSLFRAPFGVFFSWFSGMPVDRNRAHNIVRQVVRMYDSRERFIIAIAPEGTRKKVREWKTGFYHIAHGAGVPIAPAFVDYRRKIAGFGPTITPTGDIAADMAIIRTFYAGVTGKHPDKQAEPEIAENKD
ncbi:MAG: lysophospholipid acyltransferase family protein [Candidatus Hydrogenedentales bacterium]